jgi:hypothetical protein
MTYPPDQPQFPAQTQPFGQQTLRPAPFSDQRFGQPPIDYFPPLEQPSNEPPLGYFPPVDERDDRPKSVGRSHSLTPRRRGSGRTALILGGCLIGVLVVLGVIRAAAGGGNGPGGSHSAARSAGPSTTARAPVPAGASVLATYAGHGSANTAKFTVSASWILKWSYNCAALGVSGNFVVAEDGGRDAGGAEVNQLGSHGQGQTHVYRNQGQHFLSVVSECSWKMQVVGTP